MSTYLYIKLWITDLPDLIPPLRMKIDILKISNVMASSQPKSLLHITVDSLVNYLPRECILELSDFCNKKTAAALEESQQIIDAYQSGEIQCGYCVNKCVCSANCNCGKCFQCDSCASYYIGGGMRCQQCEADLCVDCRLECATCELCKWQFCEECWSNICCNECNLTLRDCERFTRNKDGEIIGTCNFCRAVLANDHE